MTKFYLEFEKPLKVIDEKIISFSSITDLKQDDISSLSKLKEERTLLIRKIYSGLSRWQRIQLARHPDRPFQWITLTICVMILSNYMETDILWTTPQLLLVLEIWIIAK